MMKRFGTILIFAGVLLLQVTGCRRLTMPHHDPADGPIPDLITESKPEELPAVDVEIANAGDPARFDNVELQEKQSFYDQMLSKVDREMLEKYEGSYSKNDLLSGTGDSSLAFSLNSSWILSGTNNYPEAGLRVRLNPATKEYEVVGGEFTLPKSGMGVSHERDEQRGENKTYFNVKKSF